MTKLASVFIVLLVLTVIAVGLTVFYENVSGSHHTAIRQQDYEISQRRRTEDNVPYSNKTYVALFDTPGQQGSGLRALSVFQCMLGSIYNHFYIVEPKIQNSHVAGVAKGEGGLNFSSLFDLNAFNLESRKAGYPEMVTMDEFAAHGPKYIIYIQVSFLRNFRKVLWKAERDAKNQSCFQHSNAEKSFNRYRSGVTKAEQDTSKVKSEHCIVRVIQLPAIRPITLSAKVKANTISRTSIYDFIFDEWSPTEVTLVFSAWTNKLYLPVDTPLHGVDCALDYAEYETKIQFQPSERLSQDAKEYEEMFLGGQNKVAVMLRVERTVKNYLKERKPSANSNKPSNLKECFQQVLNSSKTILSTTNTKLKPVVTLDLDKFGTGSYHNLDRTTKELSRKALMDLYDNQWSVNDWQKSFTQVIDRKVDRSYIAALQKTLASRADCLVLMGGGSFQAFAVQEYLDYHRNSKEHCIELVCVMTHDNSEVQKTISFHSGK